MREYFYYGKGLSDVLGDRLPPATLPLHLEAAKVGLKATWSAGLIVGVALLIANNPRAGRPQLTYRELAGRLPSMLLVTAITAAVLGALGYGGLFTHFSDDFREMLARDEFRPRRFMLVFGVHLGGYVGGLIGSVAAVVSITRRRAAYGRCAPEPAGIAGPKGS